jgi:hypothetical protein
MVLGKRYRVIVEVDNTGIGSAEFRINGQSHNINPPGILDPASTTQNRFVQAYETGTLQIYPDATGTDMFISSITLQEVS